jgi:recombination protein RecR
MSNYNAEPLERLIKNFSKLNGVGRKSATRMAYQIMSMSQEEADEFANAVRDVHTKIKRCPICQNYTDKDICPICSSPKRESDIICVVESPRDVSTFEKTNEFHGLYHVLHGLISPMDGITAEQLTIKELLHRIDSGKIKEVIMATSPTIEGETTAMYISRLIKPFGIKVTRLAYGLPVGASLEFADEVTLYRALEGRREM